MKKIISIIDKTNDTIGKVLSFGVLIILAVITFEVVSRRVFNSPTVWAFEVIVMTFAAYVILITPYGLLKGSFVCVDVLSSKYSPKLAHIMKLITYLIFFVPFTFGIFPESIKFFINSITSNEKSWSAWAPVVWPVKLALCVGFGLLILQGLSEMLKSVVWLREEPKKQIK